MRDNFQFRKSAGFTLLELIIVIAVLSILSAGIISIINPYEQIQKSNDGRRKSDLSRTQKALELYYEDNGRYPPVAADGTYQIVGLNNNNVPWGSSFPPYLDLLPKDPDSSKTYVYYSDPVGQVYYLYASLERGVEDKQSCNKGNQCESVSRLNPIPTCGSTCNYGVSSPNASL